MSMLLLIRIEINDKSFSYIHTKKVKVYNQIELGVWAPNHNACMQFKLSLLCEKLLEDAEWLEGSEERMCRNFSIIYAHMQFHFILYSFQIIILNLKRKISSKRGRWKLFTYACIIGERKIDSLKIISGFFFLMLGDCAWCLSITMHEKRRRRRRRELEILSS